MGITDRYGISRTFMFCMDEPDRHPAFRAPNDRSLEFAKRSNGRFIPFVRLDLSEEPIEEAMRCLDLGARGIKLHPRAQRFLLNDERLAPMFELAAERRVPILIHGGRGLPPIADNLARLVDALPGRAADHRARAGSPTWPRSPSASPARRGVFFDTSVWSPVDLLDMFRHVSAEQVLFASDYPYGQQPSSLLIALRTARAAGLDEDEVRNMLGRQRRPDRRRRAAARTDQAARRRRLHPADDLRAHPPVPLDGDSASLDAPAGHDRRPRPRAERDERAERQRAGGPRADQGAALDRARPVARAPEIEDEQEKRRLSRMTFRLIHLADIWAVTADV